MSFDSIIFDGFAIMSRETDSLSLISKPFGALLTNHVVAIF
jgi:hypothetical protein